MFVFLSVFAIMYLMKNWLNEKNIVITGASSGIGKELVKLLIYKHNCKVLGVARTQEKLEGLKKSLNEKSKNFDYLALDVCKKESWDTICDLAKKNKCSIVINNAGVMLPFKKACDISENEVKKVFETNFCSCLFSYNVFCKYLRKIENSAIINITSASAIGIIPGQSIYSASKSALSSFSRTISCEEKGKIFVATYLPGLTSTNLFFSKKDEEKIFSEKDYIKIKKLAMPADKLAKKIVKSILKKKRYKSFGKDSKILYYINKLAPNKSSDLILKIFRNSGLSCFDNIKD